MIKYLKYIALVFGSIGFMAASFFYYQNKNDLKFSFEFNERIDYEYAKKNCLAVSDNYYFPCLMKEYKDFLKHVSLTGTNIGLRMMFKAMDEDKIAWTKYSDQKVKNIYYTLNYLRVNNMAIANAKKRYFGFDALYGGYIASLDEFYERAFEFSENLIRGMESSEGLTQFQDPELNKEFLEVRKEYFELKSKVQEFISSERERIAQDAS